MDSDKVAHFLRHSVYSEHNYNFKIYGGSLGMEKLYCPMCYYSTWKD